MSETRKNGLIKYGLALLVIVAAVWSYVSSFENFTELTPMGKYMVLCDAFTIPGVLLLMIGAMFAVTAAGALDGISYVLEVGLGRLLPSKALKKKEKYFDYVERKKAKRNRGYGFLLISGSGCLAIALVFLILYYNA